jgi:protein-disulfide isomerase
MATEQRTSARRTGRKVEPRSRRPLWIAVYLALMALALIGGVAFLGQRSTEQRQADNLGPITVSDHEAPPSAEPNGRAWGPKDAPIQVIEYADYECEACGYFARTYEAEVIKAFADTGKVRFEIRNAPFHGEGSRNAAEAAYCAADQNAFWPMHDSLFLNQPTVEGTGPEVFSKVRLNQIATELKLDTAAFGQCLSSGAYSAQVVQDLQATQAAGVSRTPTFVINGKTYPGVQSVDDLRRIFAEVAPDVQLNP